MIIVRKDGRRIFLRIKKLLIILIQLLILLVLNKVGFFIVHFIHLPIPGNVMGMLLLFLLLFTGLIRLEWIDSASSILIKHLSFFFIPISVGLMTMGAIFIKEGIPLFVTLLLSTILGIIVSGSLAQVVLKRKEAADSEHYHHHI
jgi:holin-like protein